MPECDSDAVGFFIWLPAKALGTDLCQIAFYPAQMIREEISDHLIPIAFTMRMD
jgi:hypothetical protein